MNFFLTFSCFSRFLSRQTQRTSKPLYNYL